MKIRRIIIGAMSTIILSILTACMSPASLLSSSITGGNSWTDIAKNWSGGLSSIAGATTILLNAQADLADVLGFKQEAALLRGDAKNIKEKGEDISGSDIESAGKNSDLVQTKMNKKIMESASLDAKMTAAIGSAGKKMAPALIKVGIGIGLLVKANLAVSGAGVPSISDIHAIPIVLQIPVLLPKAILTIPKIFETANGFWKVAAEKNIAMPEIPAAPEFS
jgi:hypothetical protein